MYLITIIYKDYKTYQVEIPDDELENFFASINKNVAYLNKEKNAGMYVPLHEIRTAYFFKQEQKECESCQQNQNLEVENASKNSNDQ